MTLLSRKADYALLILSFLHRTAEGACARAIAEQFSLSRAFVANILKELCQKGFVTSHRGVKGGYVLQRSAEDITLAELLVAIDEPFHTAACSDDAPADACSLTHCCPVRGAVGDVHRRILEVLRAVSLADLFRPTPPVETFQPVLATLPLRDGLVGGLAN
jgi:Rrf2 family transcriptional regulator, cysteine metabolism repressor